ncbi:hypothetical protein D1007_04976 [Hordeum vulgare]|nr:hypothetical protein D1007_04976 [Hordeum vulgare]
MISMRASLYTDDAITFANPDKSEVDTLLFLLSCFGEDSSVIPINCSGLPLSEGNVMNMAGRRVQVRVVLAVLPIFAMTALKVPKKILK